MGTARGTGHDIKISETTQLILKSIGYTPLGSIFRWDWGLGTVGARGTGDDQPRCAETLKEFLVHL